MVVKMNNKLEGFYGYMGKIFGSRIVQRQINDRIYDDNDKEWYTYVEDERVVACVSILNGVIKNVYTINEFVGVSEELPNPYGKPLTAYGECFEILTGLIDKLADKLNSYAKGEE